MNKPLKWIQGWTAQSETLISITQVCMWRQAGWLHEKTGRGCRNCPGLKTTKLHEWLHYNTRQRNWLMLALNSGFIATFFTESCSNFWRAYFKCRCVTWRAACVESLFPRLFCSSLCSDMFLSPSPKFPSFRERSEARDCDLPWGWVKDSPLPPCLERWAIPPHLFILYTPESLILSWINWQRAERAAVSSFQLYFGLFGLINKCSAGGCMESLCMRKRREKHGEFTDLKIKQSVYYPMDVMALV